MQHRLVLLQKILLVLFVTVVVLFLYTLLHEGGHALVGWLAGGRLTAFNVNFLTLTAHVAQQGDFTPTQTIVNNLAGTALPLLVWLSLMGLAPRRTNLALEALKVISSLVCINTLLTWIVLPLFFLFGAAPDDDVVYFLDHTAVPPWGVTVIALLLYVGGWWLFLAKVEGIRHTLARLYTTTAPMRQPGVRSTLVTLLGLFVLGGGIAFSANGFRFTAPPPGQAPPANYQLVATVDLAAAPTAQQTIYTLTLDQPQDIGIYVLLAAVNADYLDLQLTGPAGYTDSLLHAEGYSARAGSAQVDAKLQAGTYFFIITSRSATGVLSLYTRTGIGLTHWERRHLWRQAGKDAGVPRALHKS